MPDEFPQFKESQPILQPTKVESGAEGYEAFAKTLGSIAQASEKKAVEVMEDQSNSMYLSSVANIDRLKLDTQKLILTDPSNAAKHVEAMRDSAYKVYQTAYVNKSDREKLRAYGLKSVNATDLDAVQASVKQSQIGAAYQHYENWPAQLNVLKDLARSGDQAKLDNYTDSLHKHLSALVASQSLTPLQAGAAIKSMSDVIDMEKDIHDVISDINKHTPQNFHAVMSNPIEPNKANNLNYPVDENTNWLVNYHSSDRSFTAASDSILRHQFDVQAYENATPAQRNQLRQEMNGVRMADGLIDSNSSLPKINNRISDLEGRTDYQSVSEKKSLKQYVEDLKNGNSQRLMARTSIGGRIVRDYSDRQAYLENQLQNTDPKNINEINRINDEIAKNKNTYVNNSIAYAQGHHWPNVHPIPKEDVEIFKNGFNVKGDASVNATNAYYTFSRYSQQNQMFFAEQLENPRQRVVAQTIALGSQVNTPNDNIDFIAANQNRNYKEIDPVTLDSVSDNYLNNVINTKITDAIKIINGQNDPINATRLNGQLIQSGINYAKFISEKNGQYSLKQEGTFNSVNNVTQVVDFINRAYEPMSGSNYIINKKQNDIEKIQMDAIAQYAINEGEAYLREHMSEAAFIQLKRQAPLTVTITPTNVVQAKDANGNPAFSAPLTHDLISKSEKEMKRIKAEKIKAGKELTKKTKQYSLFLSPEEQLLKLNVGEGNVD